MRKVNAAVTIRARVDPGPRSLCVEMARQLVQDRHRTQARRGCQHRADVTGPDIGQGIGAGARGSRFCVAPAACLGLGLQAAGGAFAEAGRCGGNSLRGLARCFIYNLTYWFVMWGPVTDVSRCGKREAVSIAPTRAQAGALMDAAPPRLTGGHPSCRGTGRGNRRGTHDADDQIPAARIMAIPSGRSGRPSAITAIFTIAATISQVCEVGAHASGVSRPVCRA